MRRISDRTVVYTTWYESEVLVMLCTHVTCESDVAGVYTRYLEDCDSMTLPVDGDARTKIDEWVGGILKARTVDRSADLLRAVEDRSKVD